VGAVGAIAPTVFEEFILIIDTHEILGFHCTGLKGRKIKANK